MGKHGGKAKTPVMLDDNLKSKQFYRVIDLISEGPIWGPVDSTGGNSFLVNHTPITDTAGNVNIPGVAVAWREGSGNQTPISGLNFIESTTIIANEVKQATPLIRTVTDPEVTRVRFNLGVTGLVQTDKQGNQSNATVALSISVRPAGGSWTSVKTVTITGKISGEYLEAHIIDAPASKPFDIQVSRVTPDSTVDTLQNGTIWNSYTEIIDDQLNYPYSAIAGAIIDHDQYTDTPARTYHLRGLIVDVPDNYDPVTRTYAGLWTGGWKQEWTNNPAWLFRELAKNPRFGLAKSAGNIEVDDGALYILSQFCDQPVPTGYGSATEPRLTLNAYITEQTTARELLDKIAGMFRGIALWDGLHLTVIIDNPADPVAVISNANVVDGKFTYSSMKRSERYNAVIVSWCDPENGWKTSKEYVSDDVLISRYGYNETTLEAFGATSRGQAYRAGRWLLESARRETRRINFQMARDAIAFMPGDIIEVMDNNYVGSRLGGRIVSHAGRVITLDAPVDASVARGDSVGLMNASGRVDHYTVASVSGVAVTLDSDPKTVIDGTVFVISTANVSTRLFRIMGVEETENNSVYTINAHQHDPHKQAVVDEGAVFEAPNDTLNGFRVPGIENLQIEDTASETVQVTASWTTATTTRGLTFEVVVYDSTGTKVVARHETQNFSYPMYGLAAGDYQLGVRARNETGMKGPETIINMRVGRPPKPESILWDKGIFSATIVPKMGINYTSDVSFEFWFAGDKDVSSPANITTEANFIGRGPQWSIQSLKASTTYYMYVRTRNGFGVSDFVGVSGEASGDIPGMLQFVDDAVRASPEFAILTAGIKNNKDDISKQTQLMNILNNDWQTFETNMTTSFTTMTTDISNMKTDVTAANNLIAQTKTDLEAQISAITGGGNSTFTGLVNDVKQLKTDNATQLQTLNGAIDRIDGLGTAMLDQVSLWREDDQVIATRVEAVSARAEQANTELTIETSSRIAGDDAISTRITKMLSSAPADQNEPARQALITAIESTETAADRAIVKSVNDLTANVGTVQGDIASEAQLRIAGDTAIGTRINNMLTGSGADSNALVQKITTVTNTGFQNEATERGKLEARLNTTDANVASEVTARADGDNALTRRMDEMIATGTDPATNADRAALIKVIDTTTTAADRALASRATALEATVDGAAGQAGLASRVSTLEQTVSTPDTTTATRLTSLESFQMDVTKNGAPADATTKQAIAGAASAAAGAASAAADAASDVAKVSAKVTALETTGVKPDSATASRITTLETNFPTVNSLATTANNTANTANATATAANGAVSGLSARIETIEKSGAAPNAAWAQRITTLESNWNGIGATVQQQVSTAVSGLNNLSSQWGIKTAVNSGGKTYVAGIQLGISTVAGQTTSNFIVSANNFTVYNPNNGGETFAFSAVGGQVFLNDAYIRNASISMAKIQTLICSNGYAQGGAGWGLNSADNSFVIRSGVSGQRIQLDSSGLSVYDGNGALRVKVGQW